MEKINLDNDGGSYIKLYEPSENNKYNGIGGCRISDIEGDEIFLSEKELLKMFAFLSEKRALFE